MIGSHKNRREIKLEQTVANLMRFKSGIYNNMVVDGGQSINSCFDAITKFKGEMENLKLKN